MQGNFTYKVCVICCYRCSYLYIQTTWCAKECSVLFIQSVPAYSDFGCGDPGTPTNGQRTFSGSSSANYVVTYTCDKFYTLQGTSIRVCLSGQWSGSVPQCIGMLVKH